MPSLGPSPLPSEVSLPLDRGTTPVGRFVGSVEPARGRWGATRARAPLATLLDRAAGGPIGCAHHWREAHGRRLPVSVPLPVPDAHRGAPAVLRGPRPLRWDGLRRQGSAHPDRVGAGVATGPKRGGNATCLVAANGEGKVKKYEGPQE